MKGGVKEEMQRKIDLWCDRMPQSMLLPLPRVSDHCRICNQLPVILDCCMIG